MDVYKTQKCAMEYTTTINDWVMQRIGKEVLELTNLSVVKQLSQYDDAGTGFGFLLLLAKVSTDDVGDSPESTQLNLLSVPMLKLRNEWVTVSDENLADIVAGVIRMVTPSSAFEVANEVTDGSAE